MTKTFESDSFLVDFDEQPGCRLSLKIQVKPKEAQKAYKKAVKIVNKQISVPGFRKGHAPDATVVSRYSSYVDQEWKEILVNEAYKGALDLIKIYPMSKESIEKPKIEKYSQEEGALVLLSYECYPNIPSVDFSSIKLPEIKKETVTDERIQDVVREVQKSQAGWEEISDREVKPGDFVDITIDSIDEDPPKNIVKDRRFEVDDKKMAPWLKSLLVGMKVGETKEGVSQVDPQADESVKKKFKSTQVKVQLHSIKKIILPEVNEELAKKVGATSPDDLMEKIRKNLEKEVEDAQRAKQTAALEDALLAKYPFDLPFSLVKSESEERIKNKIQSLKEDNISDEEIQSRQKEIEKETLAEVERGLKIYFLNKQIARQGNLSLTNQELNEELVRQISRNPDYYGKDLTKESSKEMVSRLASLLMQKKAENYALSQVLTVRERT